MFYLKPLQPRGLVGFWNGKGGDRPRPSGPVWQSGFPEHGNFLIIPPALWAEVVWRRVSGIHPFPPSLGEGFTPSPYPAAKSTPLACDGLMSLASRVVDGLIYKAFRVNAKSPRTVHVFMCETIRVPEDLTY